VLSEFLRDVGNAQLVVFAFLVIVFARFFRQGLWGLLLAAVGFWRARPVAPSPAAK